MSEDIGSTEVTGLPTDPGPTASADRYRVLPERVPVEQTIATIDAEAVPDPTMGRDTDHEWLLRNVGP
ncbi:heme biosynthesis protein HemY [Actinotalea sp. K2]|uniref:heme biosynthesis protein HemY n=1 Tax=Actinotalea sp. K2 TaxID=2939438 RepID=UPI002017D84E|nr:heme biosynthesis protein HemY [Actinotalea sp. K2]MCL3860927.1 heme biosynthesis protein HemY [Actinotalea sp. K2]